MPSSMVENQLPMLLGHEGDGMKAALTDAKPVSELVQLYQACANGDPVNAKRLMAQVDVKSKDYAGRTPLHLACGCKSAGAKEVGIERIGQDRRRP